MFGTDRRFPVELMGISQRIGRSRPDPGAPTDRLQGLPTFISPKSMTHLRTAPGRQSVLLGSLIGVIVNLSIYFPAPVRAETVLGVVRSPSNAAEWTRVERRLQTSDIRHRAIDIDAIDSPEALSGIEVLFLPNVEVLTTDQIRILERWVKQGGRLIASGPVGNRSTPLARQLLRSLLGSYWAFPLSNPARPEAQEGRCRDRICHSVTDWAPTMDTEATVPGGVLIPATLQSYTAGIWEGSGNSAAAIATQQAIYLGWHWGQSESPEVDAAWLQAAIGRYTMGTGGTQAAPQTATVQMPPPPAPAATVQTPPPPAPVTTPPPAQISDRRGGPLNPRPSLLDLFTDPSQQSAPPALEVQPGNDPIDNATAISMREELANLLGRFENALIASYSGDVPINLQVASAQLDDAVAGVQTVAAVPKPARDAIAQAEEAIAQFPQLVAQQNWTAARQLWLEARQQLWRYYPTDGERAGAEIRAVWLDRGTIVAARGEAGLRQVFDRLAEAGINTVFFETLNAGYPIYPSRVAPEQNPLTVGWDPLAAAVKLAHERDMELHAWIWTFATANQRHNPLVKRPETYLGPVLSAHPDWANLDNRARTWHENDRKAYLDPANREARSYLLRVVGEIASTYEVDGVQLDYIRYPFQDPNRNFNFGYGIAARSQFKQMTGVDPVTITPGSPTMWQRWVQFKADQITSFVGEVQQLLRLNYPDVILSVAVFPHPEAERIRQIQQHWEVWAREGYVDLIVPMTYSLDTNRLQRIAEPLTRPEMLRGTLIAPAVKLLEIPNIVAIDQIQALRDLPAGGYSIFAVETIDNNLQGFFRRTQNGKASESAIIPYREPYKAALSRYLALKREWSFLLANDQLWIGDAELKALGTKADSLAEALEALAESPSPQNLREAKQKLVSFKAQFTRAMTLQAREKPYQVSSWKNRLVSLEMLLSYGERRQF